MHEQFEAIHPFLDGNGRIGRLLITLFLLERGRLSQPLLYLSTYIEAHRQEYYTLLQGVRTDADWRSWLLYFLTGVYETSLAAVDQAHRLTDLRETFRDQLRGRGRALELVDHLFVNPFVTVTGASGLLNVSNETARQAIHELERNGIVEEISGRGWGRLYLARAILNVIEGQLA